MSENKGPLCFGFSLGLTPWSNFYYYITNMKMLWIFCSPLQANKAVGKAKQSSWPGFQKFPCHSPHKYNKNAPVKKKKCCTFSRYSNQKYWALELSRLSWLYLVEISISLEYALFLHGIWLPLYGFFFVNPHHKVSASIPRSVAQSPELKGNEICQIQVDDMREA